MKNIVFTGIGSNVGDPVANCLKAIECLQQIGSSRIVSQSSLYKTEPVGYSEQEWFVNCVLKVETNWEIRPFLQLTKEIEKHFGSRSHRRWGPRKMDIDILFYNKDCINEKDLQVPHPMVPKRRFVLLPMAEIDPSFIHPELNRNIQDLLADVGEDQQIIPMNAGFGEC